MTTLHEMAEELAALERDAARYRWLRAQFEFGAEWFIARRGPGSPGISHWSFDAADEEIDHARNKG